MPNRNRLFILLSASLIVSLLVLAGCGSSAAPSPTAIPPTPPPPTETAPPPVPTPISPTSPPPTDSPAESTTSDAASEPTTAGDSGPQVRTFQIVAEESEASYTVNEEFFQGAVTRLGKALGLFTPVGVTNQIEGEITLANLETIPTIESGQFIVNIKSLTTDDRRRDERIREQFLESAKYPLATFVPIAIEDAPGSYEDGEAVSFKVRGDMTIRDVTQPVTLDVTATLDGNTLTGVATAMILMTDFGFDPPEIGGFMKAENDVLITINFTATASGT